MIVAGCGKVKSIRTSLFLICLLIMPSFVLCATNELLIKEELIHTVPKGMGLITLVQKGDHYYYIADKGSGGKYWIFLDGVEQDIVLYNKTWAELNNIKILTNGKCLQIDNTRFIGILPFPEKFLDMAGVLGMGTVLHEIHVSEDEKHIAYLLENGDKLSVVVDDKIIFNTEKLKKKHSYFSFKPFFHSDTSEFDFEITNYHGPKIFSPIVFVGNKATKGNQLQFANGGKSYAYVDQSVENKETVILNGKPIASYLEIGCLELSPNGDQVLYATKDLNKYCVFENETKIGSFNMGVGKPIYTYDGKHYFFFASDNEKVVDLYMDGKKIWTIEDRVIKNFISKPILSQNGNRFASIWGKGFEYDVHIGTTSGTPDIIDLIFKGESLPGFLFSPSGKNFCFLGLKSHWDPHIFRLTVALNGQESRLYNCIDKITLSDSQLSFMAVDRIRPFKDNKIFKVTWEIK